MQIISVLTSKSKTIQANSTVSTMASSGGLVKVTTTAAHGLETGDIVQISNTTGTVEANGQWIVAVIDTTHFTLNNSTFVNAYVSGGTVAHVGWSTPLAAFNNTFFLNTPIDLTGKFLVQSAPVNFIFRWVIDDASIGDTTFLTAMPGPTGGFAGGASAKSDYLWSFLYSDFPDLRLQIENSWRLRVLFGHPVPGNAFTFSFWMEY
jgi:hypothetical protein